MRRLVVFGAVASLVLVSVGGATAGSEPPPLDVSSIWPVSVPAADTPAADHARGLVFTGLEPGSTDDGCEGGYTMEVPAGTICTHGPDIAPPGIDVRTPRSVAELRLQTLSLPTVAGGPSGDHSPVGEGLTHVHADGSVHDHGVVAADSTSDSFAASEGIVPIIGDGVSGNRVLAVYAVAADQADRYDEIAPLIANWAAHIDAMVNDSAALTGGERHVRFVTDPSGGLEVAKVVMPADGDDSFGNTISALQDAGFSDPSHKYLIWTDANLYCGIATIYSDDKPTQDNANNGKYPMYSRIDAGCWGFTSSVELHEVIHTMGAVQQSAPHVTPSWHCTDEYDRMCYKDSSTVEMSYVCGFEMENLLDCGHDDYFHTSPSPGSYLADHWNVADSSFLHAGPVDGEPPPPPPPPTNSPPDVSVSGPVSVTLPDVATLDGTVTDDGLVDPYTVAWTAAGPGTVTFADPAAEDTTASFSTEGTYTLTLTANDGELTGSASLTVVVEPEAEPPPPPDNTAPVVTVSGPGLVTLPDVATLDGTVSDDGLPDPYTVLWTGSGPGTVTFADPTAEDTTASFSVAGTYTLTLTADDGELTDSATLTVVVEEPAGPTEITETHESSLNKKWTERTYDVVAAAGPISAELAFGSDTDTKGNGNGNGKKSAAPTELTLTLYDSAGMVIDTVTGVAPLTLSADVAAGTYTWEVAGPSTRFDLTLTYLVE